MGDGDTGHAGPVENGGQFIHQPLAQRPIQRAQRLVEHQEARLGGQAAGQRHSLPLAARELVNVAALESRQPDQFQYLGHPRRYRFALQFFHSQSKGDVAKNVLVGKEGIFLEHQSKAAPVRGRAGHVLPVHQHLAAIERL